MTSVIEQQHEYQQQQYVSAGGSAGAKLRCKDCGMNFDSSSSLDVHLHYHQENLLNQWASQAHQQEESNNNNNKTGNHNSGGHVSRSTVKRESVTAPADSSESSSRPPSKGLVASSSRLNQQHHQQVIKHHYSTPMFGESQYFMHNEAPYILPHHYSPDRGEDGGPSPRGLLGATSGYVRYHPYQHSQHFAGERTTSQSVSSTSPRSVLQCDKCGIVYEDANQLAEHARTSHPITPSANSYPAPPVAQLQQQLPQSQSQYEQMVDNPQQQQQITQSQQNQKQTQQQHMHAPPPQTRPNQHQHHPQESSYDFADPVIKSEVKQEPEEQTEILDLDSHKVQTHRYEDGFMRLENQHQQEMHIQMQHQVIQQQQQSRGTHSVTSMLRWSPASQPHDYHSMLSPMGPMETVSSIQEQQNQLMRAQQHIPLVEPPQHPGSPVITSTQSIPGHPISTSLLQQNPKPPPLGNQSWKSNEARRPKTYNCTACNKWFTSSGHLKRHYNTTLHKNAVKQSNQPDPANMPISAHHHPGRDTNSARSAATNRNSPELSSSSSPPNLTAGPSGEATRGLLYTPTTTTTIFSNNNSNSSSNSSETTAVQAALGQKILQQPQQQLSTDMLGPNVVFIGSPALPSMVQVQAQGQAEQQHIQQMGSLTPHLDHPQHQQHHHLPMDSPSHHPMNSPMSPMQQHPSHMNSPSPMALLHHHMSSSSPIMAGMVPAVMTSPPPDAMMRGTTIYHQPYPNGLPPHVTTITSIPGLLESITNQLTTTGNSDMHPISTIQQHQHQELLPGFGTLSNHHQHHQQKMLPNYTQFGSIANGFIVGRTPAQAANVGGLSPEENMPPQDRSFESSVSSYDIYRNSSPRYEYLGSMEMMLTPDGPISNYSELQRHKQLQQHLVMSSRQQQSAHEANNNLPHISAKEELDPNIVDKRPSVMLEKNNSKFETKEHQVTSTNTGSHYISENGLHKCIECDKVFNKACYLTQHNKSFHSGDKPFKCNQCGKRFPHEYLHAEHLQKHAGEKPYKCEICPKQFNHKTDLRRHMCLHTGEKPYACDTCGKGFIRKDHMMKHLETHRKKSNNHHKIHLRA